VSKAFVQAVSPSAISPLVNHARIVCGGEAGETPFGYRHTNSANARYLTGSIDMRYRSPHAVIRFDEEFSRLGRIADPTPQELGKV
jgi:hypothetical protein